MDAEDRALDAGGLRNDAARAFVRQWAAHTQPAAGEVAPVTGGRYYARSYVKDTARSEERTFVATSNAADRGVYNNWLPADEVKPVVEGLMAGASRGKTMFVLPFPMAPPGTPLDAWAPGVELTGSRVVVLHMIRMARVGPRHLGHPAGPSHLLPGPHP